MVDRIRRTVLKAGAAATVMAAPRLRIHDHEVGAALSLLPFSAGGVRSTIRRLAALVLVATLAAVNAVAQPAASTQASTQAQSPGTTPGITTPNDYTQDSNWLCRPGRTGANDGCAIDLTAAVVAADGSTVRESYTPKPAAPIDCFYVYPTVSTDSGTNSDMTPDAAERNVIAQQFARFGSVCRLFAPSYRQVTLVGLRQVMMSGLDGLSRGLAYDDVRDAWRDYLRRDNRGRGVVLIGHSQGTYLLMRLLREEVEGKPVQKQLVSAILMGGTVVVPKGARTGGTFASLASCQSPAETGCIISFSTFRSTVPAPADALFGRAPAGQVAVCTNPATFTDAAGDLHSYFATTRPLIAQLQPTQVRWTATKAVDEPWVTVPGLLSARCVTNEHATFLEITVRPNPADARLDEIPGDLGAPGKPLASWGLHLVDVNLTMGNLLSVVARQSATWAARK